MDRYLGPGPEGDDGGEYAHFLLLMEREQWLRDHAAIAEYESWYRHKTIMEADAENVAEQ
jgi:hypothetical protein